MYQNQAITDPMLEASDRFGPGSGTLRHIYREVVSNIQIYKQKPNEPLYTKCIHDCTAIFIYNTHSLFNKKHHTQAYTEVDKNDHT